ncbi:hypothetical protein N7536_009023, partial [Penicillium majusculum]
SEYTRKVVVAIREYTKGDVAKIRRLYDILNHDNILTAREVAYGVSVSLSYGGGISFYDLSLIYRNILLGLDSVIKIASLEIYVERPPVGVDNVDRWPIDSDAFRFLSALSIIKSIKSLKEVPKPIYHDNRLSVKKVD